MLRHEDLTEPDLLRLLYSKDCYRTFILSNKQFSHGFDRNRWPKTKSETPRPRSQKFENPRRKETQENEISRLIENSSEISKLEQNFRDPEFSGYHSPPLIII